MPPEDDRTAWIDRRKDAGMSLAPLLKAMSLLVVRPGEDGEIMVDSSAIEKDPYYPTSHVLAHYDEDADGHWGHEGSGESGPLVEMLASIALAATERKALHRRMEITKD